MIIRRGMETKDINSLLCDLNDVDWWRRSSAIKALLTHPIESYVSFMESAIRNQEDATLRNASMELYRAIGGNALPSLLNLLRDKDEETRLFAVNLLGDIKDRRSAPALISSLKDLDINVRIASAEALGHIAAPEAVGALAECLGDEPWVALSAIKSLGDIGGEQALEILYHCLENPEHRGMAFEAIEKAGNANSVRKLSSYIEDFEMKELALKAIVNISEREGIKPMPLYFRGIVPVLIELQRSVRPEIKRAAFVALSWAEDTRGIGVFIDTLTNEELQEYAINGLINLGKKSAQAVIDSLKDKKRSQRYVLAKLLTMLGEHTALIQFANDPDPEVRVEVAFGLGHLHTPKAMETLKVLSQDPEDEVSSAASVSLHNIEANAR